MPPLLRRVKRAIMATDQKLSLETRTTLRLSAQQLRFVKLLECNAPELEETVDRELEENPALDIVDNPSNKEDEDRYIPYFNRRGGEDTPTPDTFAQASPETLVEMLVRQLSERKMSEKVADAARFIIGNLDSNGYLRRPLEGIVNDMDFGSGIEVSLHDAQKALEIVQSLEPYGVGASDLQECMLIQLRHLPDSKRRNNALKIVELQFDALGKRHVDRISSRLKMSAAEVADAVSLIRSLNPKPGAALASDTDRLNVIIPDVAVSLEDGDISIVLTNNLPELTIDRSFSEAMERLNASGARKKPKGSEFITSRFNDARDFIRILSQRQETLMAVATAIVKIQHDYFLTRDIYQLKPMMLKDIAALTGFDFSVISRATANKYISTPWGIFPMRFFFSDTIGDESGNDAKEQLTNRKIEAQIADIVNKEDKKHPLSDEKIKEELSRRGFEVSRRTIAKYRDRAGIPVARLRREP